MKLIHCADIHLHSSLNTHFSVQQAKERNGELLSSFINMVEYGSRHGVSVILIAGDLFDTASIPQSLQNSLITVIRSHPDMTFFYLRGNHDENQMLDGRWQQLDHLHGFESDVWTTYRIPLKEHSLTITGMELSDHSAFDNLQLKTEDINIVMLHGQIRDYGKRDGCSIPLQKLMYRNIDYLALGHIHSYEQGLLKPAGTWCYSGSLEGRGFDEQGEHGFVMIDVNAEKRSVSSTFIPFAQRKVHLIKVDVSACESKLEMVQKAKEMITPEMKNDMVRIVLCGNVDISFDTDIITMEKLLEDTCWYVEVKDETKLIVNYEEYAKDRSLKGEFVRQVYEDPSLDSAMKAEIIRCGIAALSGEDLL